MKTHSTTSSSPSLPPSSPPPSSSSVLPTTPPSSSSSSSSPSQPPSSIGSHYLSEFKITSSTKDSFSLDWEVLPEFEKLVEGFKVRYKASGSNIVQHSKKIDGKHRTVNIQHLHENTEYEVCLWALFLGSPATFVSSFQVLKNLSDAYNQSLNVQLEPTDVKDVVSRVNEEKVIPYCVKASTGYNGAWVALGSALAATIVIGLIVFVVFLASRQSVNKDKKNQKSTSDQEKKRRKWWQNSRTGRCPLHRSDSRVNYDIGMVKSGFLSNLKKKKMRRGFRLKNQLHSSKSVLGCQIDVNENLNCQADETTLCSCNQQHSKRSKKKRSEILFGGRDEKSSSVHSSLLSLIQDEPGNCYLVATSTSAEDPKDSSGTEQVTHELAYLIPIMKCQDGTFVLGADPAKAEALLDLPLEEMVDDEELYELEENQDDFGEPFDGDFDLLPVLFHPDCGLSVVDSLYVGDVLTIQDEDEEAPSPAPGKIDEKDEETLGLKSTTCLKRDLSSFSNLPMPKTKV